MLEDVFFLILQTKLIKINQKNKNSFSRRINFQIRLEAFSQTRVGLKEYSKTL
jgi:hypothetical protein